MNFYGKDFNYVEVFKFLDFEVVKIDLKNLMIES